MSAELIAEVAEWQYRTHNADGIWSMWISCTEGHRRAIEETGRSGDYPAQLRGLYPATALSLAESRGRQIGREEAAALVEQRSRKLQQLSAWTDPGDELADLVAAIRNLPANEAGECQNQ